MIPACGPGIAASAPSALPSGMETSAPTWRATIDFVATMAAGACWCRRWPAVPGVFRGQQQAGFTRWTDDVNGYQ